MSAIATIRVPRLNCGELAKVLKKPLNFVTALRRAGYVFKYEAMGRTTEEHALAVIEAHPEFLAHAYLTKGWKRRPKILANQPNPPA